MARSVVHQAEDILDATRDLLLSRGTRAASIAAIAKASGAPVGSLYHRFGSRDALLAEVWLRALSRFHSHFFAAAEQDDPALAAAAMAAAVITFAREHPSDSRVLMTVRSRDLFDHQPAQALRARREAMNAQLDAVIRELASSRYGRADRRAIERVRFAVVDLPAAALRRHTDTATALPEWLESEVSSAATGILTSPA
ncbi:MAG TPA: TetR/AcrR family transcriptional regulator [Solirubrobacteraceae bacterium]